MTVKHALDAITELRTAIDWLVASLLPGTEQPYRPPSMSADARAERDRLARLERLERSNLAPGETPAPLDLDIADLLAEILTFADTTAERVCWAVHRPVDEPPRSAFADPGPALRLITGNLRLAATVDSGLPRFVEERCDELVTRAHTILGLLGDGQLLDVVCPWCGGRRDDAPVGGAKTMRVRAQLPPGQAMSKVDPKDVRWLVVCESGSCEPPPAECGERLRGRPAWPLKTEGEWLAMRLEAAIAS